MGHSAHPGWWSDSKAVKFAASRASAVRVRLLPTAKPVRSHAPVVADPPRGVGDEQQAEDEHRGGGSVGAPLVAARPCSRSCPSSTGCSRRARRSLKFRHILPMTGGTGGRGVAVAPGGGLQGSRSFRAHAATPPSPPVARGHGRNGP